MTHDMGRKPKQHYPSEGDRAEPPVADVMEARAQALKRVQVFSGWPDQTVMLLAKRSRTESMAAHVSIQTVGQMLNAVHVLVRGTTQSGVTDAAGRRVSLRVHQPGDVHGLFLWTSGTRELRHDLVTLTPCTFVVIPLHALDQALAAEPHLWQSLAVETARRLLNALEMALSFGLETPRARFARRILQQMESSDHVPEGPSRLVPMSQQVMAELVGVSRPTAISLVREFERLGLIKWHYGQVEILDLKGLRLVSQFEWGNDAPR